MNWLCLTYLTIAYKDGTASLFSFLRFACVLLAKR